MHRFGSSAQHFVGHDVQPSQFTSADNFVRTDNTAAQTVPGPLTVAGTLNASSSLNCDMLVVDSDGTYPSQDQISGEVRCQALNVGNPANIADSVGDVSLKGDLYVEGTTLMKGNMNLVGATLTCDSNVNITGSSTVLNCTGSIKSDDLELGDQSYSHSAMTGTDIASGELRCVKVNVGDLGTAALEGGISTLGLIKQAILRLTFKPSIPTWIGTIPFMDPPPLYRPINKVGNTLRL